MNVLGPDQVGTCGERLSIRHTLPNPGEGVRPMPTKWNFEAEYIQSCNCAWGCPCNFDALPTTGSCEALVSWHIKKGTFGTTKLDGTTFAWGLWWPRAIHMGNGVGRLYLDPKAKPDQRVAIEKIVGGKEGGGVFAVFPSTFAKTFPTKTAKIDFKFKGHDSAFTVDGVGEVQSEHIRNPVTGEPFEGFILLPGGINMKKSTVTNIRRWSLRDDAAGWNMAHENVAGFVTVQRYNEKGPVKAAG
ncbi:MAG: DUF1326 domain-containing protein [Methanobacteriota archaeon]|nr:MAG: DUF1326 domain-containing protein [Euryarchaeota archaeon]